MLIIVCPVVVVVFIYKELSSVCTHRAVGSGAIGATMVVPLFVIMVVIGVAPRG